MVHWFGLPVGLPEKLLNDLPEERVVRASTDALSLVGGAVSRSIVGSLLDDASKACTAIF